MASKAYKSVVGKNVAKTMGMSPKMKKSSGNKGSGFPALKFKKGKK